MKTQEKGIVDQGSEAAVGRRWEVKPQGESSDRVLELGKWVVRPMLVKVSD